MHQRCSNNKHKDFAYYGGRGIKVCERWLTFENFLDDMGERPEGMSLDRIDVDGDYCPENCRWADRVAQARNTRANHFVTYNGNMITVAQFAEVLGVNYHTLHTWVKRRGMSPEECVARAEKRMKRLGK